MACGAAPPLLWWPWAGLLAWLGQPSQERASFRATSLLENSYPAVLYVSSLSAAPGDTLRFSVMGDTVLKAGWSDVQARRQWGGLEEKQRGS
mmetsp:Transcript_42732/g.96706  ORF Transcript_42732/g.96706 Transcript_42732/m.96706 type:complete len:92 (+) Transcript_42732:276-551(+)